MKPCRDTMHCTVILCATMRDDGNYHIPVEKDALILSAVGAPICQRAAWRDV
jgi:hypothetical protein